MSRQSLNELLLQSMDSPEFRHALVQLSEEKATRPIRNCSCVVVETPETADPHDFPHLTPGTVTAFVAQEGEPLLTKLTDTIKANNSKECDSTLEEINKMQEEFFRKIAASYPEIPSRTSQSFADISYANKTLVSFVQVDEMARVAVHPFVYNGGHLDGNRFAMSEYYKSGHNTPLTCVLIVRRPKLSEIEREALRLVPSDSSANNIGSSVAQPITPALRDFVVAMTPYAAKFVYDWAVYFLHILLYGGGITSISDEILESKAFRDRLKSLPPEATAAELLRLRIEALLNQQPK